MTSAMDDVYYRRRNFNMDIRDRHPTWITERHFMYHLCQSAESGMLTCLKNELGEPLQSPRRLRDICIYKLVQKPQLLEHTDPQLFPTNIYPIILSEAIFLREARAIEWAVSIWPMTYLRVLDMIPQEEYLENDYLTMPMEENSTSSLIDCFLLGLLKLKPCSQLKYLDFTWFEKDRSLCKELCRLPVLWMKPSDREVENLHDNITESTVVSKDKVQRFLNRIERVYSNLDHEYHHGNKISPVTILLDLKVTVDDVPLGLSLQHVTPFKFACNRIWMKPIPEVTLAPCNLGKLLDLSRITHFELEDPLLPEDPTKFLSLLEALGSLRNLIALSLPNSVSVQARQNMAVEINAKLRKLKLLARLNLSYCSLQGHLEQLLGGLTQKLLYLNLTDCRLIEDDYFFLVSWKPLMSLRELNLSSNNLALFDQVMIAFLERMSHLTCFSVSYCQLSTHSQVLIARECKELSRLKVLCMQSYTPLPDSDILEILHIVSVIPSLQKVLLLPETYAFPGNNDAERETNKYHMLRDCYSYLSMRQRSDIELE